MIEFAPEPVDSPRAVELLTEYFEYRADSFPIAGGYRPTFPTTDAFTPPRGVFVVAYDENPIGCGGIRHLSGNRWEVKHLWMRPTARGKGLGRAMLTDLEERAITFGATELVLDTNSSLEAAGNLYRSAGFVSIEPYTNNPNATDWYLKRL